MMVSMSRSGDLDNGFPESADSKSDDREQRARRESRRREEDQRQEQEKTVERESVLAPSIHDIYTIYNFWALGAGGIEQT